MGKDNSSSKSELIVQLDKTNELLKKRTESLEEGWQKLKEEERKNADKKMILESFLRELICVEKPNVLSCKHNFCERVAPYLTDAEINKYNELLNCKEGEDKVSEELKEKMKKYFNGILDELNGIIKFELYMEN